MIAEKYGETQLHEWRRSFSVRPPPIEREDKYWPGHDVRYANIMDQIPLSESLQDAAMRTLPMWHSEIAPLLSMRKTVLIVAHGNSIRGLLKYLDNISDQDITKVEIPTAMPLVYSLDSNLKPLNQVNGVFSGQFLPTNIEESELKLKLPEPLDLSPSLLQSQSNQVEMQIHQH
jgi:2,3-bisphosphoglycerate-dependent phosphoglycerate mutase